MKKRIISLFMCLVMAFSLLPTAAWAELLSVTEDGQQEQVVADPSGDEVQPGDEGENVGGEDADGGTEDGAPVEDGEDGAPAEEGEDGEDGGDNGDADAPTGEDEQPVAPQSNEGDESNEVVSSVTADNAVAQIGEVYYATLPEALNAANDGDTVTMLADHVTNWNALNDFGDNFTFEDYASIVPVVTKTLTLELNSKTVDYLEVGFSETNEETKKKEIIKTGHLTVTSESPYGIIIDLMFMSGTLDIRGGQIGILVNNNGVESPDRGLVCDVNSGTATISTGMVYGLTVLEGAAVTVEQGFNHRGQWSVDPGGTLSITGGAFKDVRFVNKGNIAISGGTFKEISNNDGNTDQPLMLLLAKNHAFVNEYITSNVKDGTATSLTEVMVKEHTHDIDEKGKCACGMTFVASVTAKDGTVSGYYTTLEDAFDNAQDYATITLLTDVVLTELLSIELNWDTGANIFTLDLNGRTISCNSGETETINVSNARLTICDNSSEKTGKVTQNDVYAVRVEASGTLIITGGTFGKVGIFSNAVISGGSFSTIASYNGNKLAGLLVTGYAFADSTTKAIVNGYQLNTADNVTVVEHKTHKFSDGTCACGAECAHDEMNSTTGKCAKCEKLLAQASVTAGESSTYYREFTNAIDAAKESTANPTVTLLQNVTLGKDESIRIGSDDPYATVQFTIDWNGHTLYGNYYSGLLTIADNVNVTLKDSSEDDAGGVTNTNGIAVMLSVYSSGSVTIEGGTYSAQVRKNKDCAGTIRISGGVFQNPPKAAMGFALYDIGGGNLAGMLAEGYTFSYDADGTDLVNVYGDDHTENGKAVYVVAHSHRYDKDTGKCACGKPCAHELDENSQCTSCHGIFVAQVGNGDYYTTVTEALKAAGNNSIVTLLKDVTESVTFGEEGKSVTLAMNGKTLTAPNNDNPALTVTSGTLTINGNATISNPYGGVLGTTQPAILVTGGKLAFEDKLTAEGGYRGNADNYFHRAYAVKATGGELDFQGELDLKGGLAVLETATLTNKLTQGAFWVDRDEKELPEEAILKVGGTTNHKYLENLLAEGYAYVDKNDTSIFRCVHSFTSWTGDVTIVAHQHTWRPGTGDLYECTVCGKSCAHDGGYKTGACTVCGKPCPHASTEQMTDYNYYCEVCGKQMVARIQTDTNRYLHFTNLPDALKAAEDGQTVKLLGNIDNSSQTAAVTGNNKTVTLDLNGKTISEGWIYVGFEDSSNQTSSTLKIVGSGSFILSGIPGLLGVGYKSTLDLSGWTDGTITRVELAKNGAVQPNTESTLIVSENIGTISELSFLNWPSSGIKTKLTGGTYGSIRITTHLNEGEPFSNMLAEGYAFRYVNSEEYVPYGTKAEYAGIDTIYNVKVVECEHTSVTNGTCDYCNTSGIAALVSNGDGTEVYGTFAAAQTAWLASGGTLKLCQSVNNMSTTAWTGDSSKTYTLDLNGYNITAANDDDSGSSNPAYEITATGMTLTVKDSSEDAAGQLDNLTLGKNSELTLESGWLGMLTVPNDESVKVQLQGGGLKGFDINVPLAYVLSDGCYLFNTEAGTALSFDATTSTSSSTFTVKRALTATGGEKTGAIPYGRNKLPFAPSAEWVSEMGTPTGITAIWYEWDGTKVTRLASAEMTLSGTGCTYNSSTETDYSEEAYAKMTVNSRHNLYVELRVNEGGTLWRAAITGYTLEIIKADAVVTAPTANSLTYTGGAQALVTAGKTSGGTLKYSLAKEDSYDTKIPTATNAGEYTVWYMVEGDSNYNGTEPQSVTVTIGKADAKLGTAPTANSLTYTGGAQALVTAGSSQDGAVEYRLGENGEFGRDIPTATDAGTYTVYYKVAGDDNHKDTAEGSVTVTIGQLSISGAEVTLGDSLTYNGKTQTQTVASVKVGGLTVPAGSYTVSNNTGVAARTYTLTVTGTGNFTGTKSVGFTIAKAALTVPEITVDVTNGYAAAYTVDLRAALDNALTAGCSFGTVSYGAPSVTMDAGYYADGSAKVENGRLTLPILANNTENTGSIGTVTVTVATGNYQNITVTVQLNAVNKIVPVGAPTLSTRTITYGEKLSTIKLSGTMRVDGAAVKGTFAWEEPYFCPTSDTYTATWVFTPEEDSKYAVVTGTVDITVVEPAEPVYTVGGIVEYYSVTDKDAAKDPVVGARVTIRKGLEIIGGQKFTDKGGMFALDGVVAGVYNVVVEYQGKTVTTKVEITDRDISVGVEIPREDVNSKLEIEKPTDLISDVVVGGLDKEAGEQFKDSDNGSVSIGMGITEPEHKENDPAQSAIRGSGELTGKTLDFIDMVLTMVKNGKKDNLPETTTVLEIIISYDTTRKDIKVVRHHVDGNNMEEVSGLTQLDTLPIEGAGKDGTFYIDYEKKCIHIFTNKFSTYAIGYTPESGNRYYYNSGTAGTKSGESPATGDVGLLPYAAMALTGCTGVVVLTFRRKREHE